MSLLFTEPSGDFLQAREGPAETYFTLVLWKGAAVLRTHWEPFHSRHCMLTGTAQLLLHETCSAHLGHQGTRVNTGECPLGAIDRPLCQLCWAPVLLTQPLGL